MIGSGPRLRCGEYQIEVLPNPDPEREDWERALSASGVVLPLPHRCDWARLRPGQASLFLAIRDAAGRLRNGYGVEVNRSRALPGHVLLRLERFGHWLGEDVREAGVSALAELACRDARVLRVNVEVFSRDPGVRGGLGDCLARHRFVPVQVRRRYADTIAVDLTPEEPAIFASFREMARRNVRKIAKFPVAIRPVADPSLGPRIDRLLRESTDRTGGGYRAHDWRRLIEFSQRSRDVSRIVGLFRTDVPGPEALIAFVWGCGHGDHAHYEAGGATRSTGWHIPLNYALMWDLICWAKQNGAKWFDLGGVTPGRGGDGEDRLGGVSDFKRYFSRDEVRVGEEWVLEPRPLRAGLARGISSGAAWLSRLWRRQPPRTPRAVR
jgi:hypothetical protein